MSATDADPYIDYRTRPEHVQRRGILWMAIVTRRQLLSWALESVNDKRALGDDSAYHAAQTRMIRLMDEIEQFEDELRTLDPAYAADVVDLCPFVRCSWEKRCGLGTGSPSLESPPADAFAVHTSEDAETPAFAIVVALRDMIDKLSYSMDDLSYDDLIAGFMTVAGQLLGERLIQACEHGAIMTRDDIAKSLEPFGPYLKETVVQRLDQYYEHVEPC